MAQPAQQFRGVSGTVDAFNFIRRIGFPPAAEVISAFITLTLLPVIICLPFSGLGLASSLIIASSVIVVPTVIGESINSMILLRGDPVLNFRRLMGMEMVSWSPILLFVPLCSLLGKTLGSTLLWADGLFLALAVSLPVRFLTIFAMSNISQARKLAASIVVPIAAFCLYIIATDYFISPPSVLVQIAIFPVVGSSAAGLLVLSVAILLSGAGVVRIIRRVDKQGGPQIGDAPIGLFRDFLRHWLKGEPEPLENRLAALGRNGKVEVSTLAFETVGGSQSCVIISNFHPGPYRDLGSGGLPSMLKSDVEASNGSITMVPHGISNHEYNIISRNDILRLVHSIRVNYPKINDISEATILVRETSRDAKASAQVFGNTVFLTLTLAPVDMEDIPTQVSDGIKTVAEEKGLHAIVADAHNSLRKQVAITSDQANMLRDAATKALNRASQMPRSPFKVGAASNPLSEFRIEEGIGPGGLSVITVGCQGQRVAYLTIDGNNMQGGFRDILLSAVKSGGIDDGEVMTTDTHLVAGVVRSPLGYHPVGEGLDKELLVSIVKETVRKAMDAMKDGSSGLATFQLDLRVLGSATFQGITSFVGRVARDIGRSFMRLELLILALSVATLVVL